MSTPTLPAPASTLDALLGQHQQDVVYIRNAMPGPTVFTTDATKADGHIVWQGTGDPNGEDIFPVPAELLRNVQFQAILRKRILMVVEDPSTAEAALAAQQGAWDAQQQRRSNVDTDSVWGIDGEKITPTVEQADQNDMVVEDCLAKTTLGCEQRVSLRLNEVGKRPPLCPGHQGLAGRYIAQEDHTAQLVKGKAPIKWIQPQIG